MTARAEAAARRRTREYVTDPDGVEHVQPKPPRADVLHYPNGWVTILVRRTHNEDLARRLAEERLRGIMDLLFAPVAAASASGRPALGRARAGWWTTVPQSAHRALLPGEALDAQQRCVAPAAHTAPAAGPGIEFLAGRTTS